jgi:hypothetical protein
MARKISCLVLLLGAALLGGCEALAPETSLDLSFSALRRETAQERSRSLFHIRQAWDFRPEGTDDTERRAERRFLNRYGIFARKLNGTGSARDAGLLWRRIFAEHQQRFPGSRD